MDLIPPTWTTWRCEEPLELEFGSTLPAWQLAHEAHGELAPQGGNVVVVLHALSGSPHAVADPGEEPGWWQEILGAGAPLGVDRHRVICPNLLGGCYGSTGPRSTNPASGRPWGGDFPQISIGDLVDTTRRLLRGIGLGPETGGPLTLVGGSMGGMLVMDWAARYPDEVGRGIVLGAPGRSFAQQIALRSVQRRAILNDPDFRDGHYPLDRPPARGLSLARQIGMITYRSDAELSKRFGRDVKDPTPHYRRGMYQIQSYLEYQGDKFVRRFDANTYLLYSRAMDLHDLGTGQASYEAGVERIQCPLELISFSSDVLCPSYQCEEIATILRQAGRPVRHTVIETIHGHDAFLIETAKINAVLEDSPLVR